MPRKRLSQGVRPDTPARAATPADSWPIWTDLVPVTLEHGCLVFRPMLDCFGDDGQPVEPFDGMIGGFRRDPERRMTGGR
jgi:hypothetical protein